MLAEFGKRKGGAAVLMPTHVSFVDRFGVTEEGNDAGGLTAEMLSLFFREVAAPHSSVHLSLTLQRTPHSSLHVSLTLHHPHCSLLTISTHTHTGCRTGGGALRAGGRRRRRGGAASVRRAARGAAPVRPRDAQGDPGRPPPGLGDRAVCARVPDRRTRAARIYRNR